jgi:alpha-2-macroglobulin
MKPKLYRKLSLAVLWLALTPVNSPAQEEPPPVTRPRIPPPSFAAAVETTARAAPVKARLRIDTKLLGPGSVIELELPKPAVPADKINTPAPAGYFSTEPEIPGEGIWITRNQARFQFSSLPPMGTIVRFSVKEGLTCEDGTPLAAGELAVVQTEPFRLANYAGANYDDRRKAVRLLVFADDVEPATAVPWLIYTNPAGARMPAKAVHLRQDESEAFRYVLGRDPYGARDRQSRGSSWTQRLRRSAEQPEDEPPPDAPVRHALLVSALEPLSTGDDWRLEILKGMPNAAGNARTTDGANCTVGSIEGQCLHRYQKPSISKGAVSIYFSLPLPRDVPPEFYTPFIRLSPEVKNLKITAAPAERLLRLESADLEYGTRYELTVGPGIASADGLVMTAAESATLFLEPMPASLAMPEADSAQLANGKRQWPIHSRNLSSVRVRVKQISAGDAVRAIQGYASMLRRGDYDRSGKVKGRDLAGQGPVPWSLVPGRLVCDDVHHWKEESDELRPVTLDWNKLIPGKSPAVLFVSAEGADFLAGSRKQHIAQAMVQLTDIGLAWKLTADEALIYAYSLTSGSPLPGTVLTLHNADSVSLASHTTAGDGTARVPRVKGGVVLTASRGADQFTVAFDRTLPRTSLYSFPVQIDWSPARDFRRQVLMFTDRGLYRPGEEVHLKGIVRRRLETDLRLAEESAAEFTVKDADSRVLLTKTVTLSGFGSFDEGFTLPQGKVGQFSAELNFPKPEAPAAQPDQPGADDAGIADERNGRKDDADDGSLIARDGYDGEGDGEEGGVDDTDRSFTHFFRVEEFRRNTFEIAMPAPQPPPGAASTEVSLSARYFMGQPLSDASIRWNVSTGDTGYYPDKFRDFLFGDHAGYDPYYWNYYYGWQGRDESDAVRREGAHDHAETTIGPDGRGNLPVVVPAREFPVSQRIQVSAEITDVNQQTLTESCSFTVHPAALHIGVGRVDSILHTGEPCTLNLVAVGENGEPLTKPQLVTLTLEHETWDTVRTVSANGLQQTQSAARRSAFLTQDVTIEAATAEKKSTPFAFTPDKSGAWHVTLRATDEVGRQTATRCRFHVSGKGEYAWEYEEGGRIRLVPEKPAWKPGETARILVMTPIEGTALVTLERGKVLRSFTVPLKLDHPIVEIPLTDDDAPNVYAGIAVIKGLAGNQREVREPVLKLGYCELKVADTRDTLTVLPVLAKDPVRPGESAEVTCTVQDRDRKPVAGAEVTLWAVDEGVLSVMGYRNPDAGRFFLPPLPLGVRFGTSLSLYLPEDEDRMAWANKGFTIGGGDGDAAPGDPSKLRKDFNPLAFWRGTLTTGADGRFTAEFKTPDSLTRYRVLALALHGARKFGTGVSALTVNKPLMIEPVVPRFASVGDLLTPKAVVHNTSQHSGRFVVTMETSRHAAFTNGERSAELHSAPTTTAGTEHATMTRELDLAAGQTKAVTFDVHFRHFGEAVWRWRAEPVTLPPDVAATERAQLVDFVEKRFPVQFPGPLLSERRAIILTDQNPGADLLAGFSKELLARPARIEVELSKSRFIECAAALDYLLVYPYG